MNSKCLKRHQHNERYVLSITIVVCMTVHNGHFLFQKQKRSAKEVNESPSKKQKTASSDNVDVTPDVDMPQDDLPEQEHHQVDPDSEYNQTLVEEEDTSEVRQRSNIASTSGDNNPRTTVSRIQSFTSTGETVSVRVETLQSVVDKLDDISSQNTVRILTDMWDVTEHNNNCVLFCISLQQLGNQFTDLLSGLSNLQNLLATLSKVRQGKAPPQELFQLLGQEPPQPGTKSTRASAASDDPSEPGITEAETELLSLFPINVYTKEIHWLLQRPMVRKFLKYETMKAVYSGLPTFKADMETVVNKFLEYTLSQRLLAHLSKASSQAAATGGKRHFGRFPLPGAVREIAEEELKGLWKKRAPGEKNVVDTMLNYCTTARRNQLLTNTYILEGSCLEEVALRYYWERMDFYQRHKVMTSW